MAKERLSKLQRWILTKCYERKHHFIYRKELMKKRIDEYYEENRERLEESKKATEAIHREIAPKIPFYIKIEMTEEEFKNVLMAKTIFQTSLTNSLKNLLHKGLIDVTPRFRYHIKGIELTKKGVEIIEKV